MRKLVIRGTFHSAGVQIGAQTASYLPFVRDKTVDLLQENYGAGSIERIRELADRYLASTQEIFPQALEYMAGLALGSRMPFKDIALISFSEEISGEAAEKCSTLAVPTDKGWLIGHNEDYEPQYFGKMFALDLKISGYPRVFSLNYPGHFPCLAGSLNECGVAITNNALWPAAVPGVSKNVTHFRAALALGMTEAIDFLSMQPAALTGHYTVAGAAGNILYGLEVSNEKTAKKNMILHQTDGKPYWHTNHVRFLELYEPDPALAAGNHTFVRAQKLERLIADDHLPSKSYEMLDLLSTNDGVLHRTPAQNPTSVTLASVAIRPKTGELWIRDADPATAERDLYLHFE